MTDTVHVDGCEQPFTAGATLKRIVGDPSALSTVSTR